MKVPTIVLTCDKYQPYWAGFFHFMERHWDKDIKSPIFFCNEEIDADVPGWCTQLKTGRGTFVENLKSSLRMVGSDMAFLMLEDFWPIAPMRRELFESLAADFVDQELDALQISNYNPLYSIRKSQRKVMGQNMMDFDPASEWVFNFQARFWRSDVLDSCLVEPEISEKTVGSAITVEMASDTFVRSSKNLKVSLYHYLWYPLSGVAYRGQMTEFGKHLQNILEIDRHVESLVS